MRQPREVFDAILRLRALQAVHADRAQRADAGIAVAMSGGFGKIKQQQTMNDVRLLLDYADPPSRMVFGDAA